jgi:hypothetical protein
MAAINMAGYWEMFLLLNLMARALTKS